MSKKRLAVTLLKTYRQADLNFLNKIFQGRTGKRFQIKRRKMDVENENTGKIEMIRELIAVDEETNEVLVSTKIGDRFRTIDNLVEGLTKHVNEHRNKKSIAA